MALPLFFSVIALVVVSTTALIIVRNRVRIRNVSESSRRNKHQSEVRSARQNATISALVNEINANTDDVNDFAKQTDGRLTNLSKSTKTRVDNIDKRLNSYHNLTTANFMGMNNRVDTEVARLDAVDDILRDKIAQERRERIAEDTKLDGLITQNRETHTAFVNSNYLPFVERTGINFQNAYDNMDRIETEYKSNDDALTSTIQTNKRELQTTINNVNSNLGERIAAVQSNLESAVFESIEADSGQLNVLQSSINQRSQLINNSLNNFFPHNDVIFSPTNETLTSFDTWAKDKYYTSLLDGNVSRTFQNLQTTINMVEYNSRQLTSNGIRLDELDTYNQTNTSNILELQEKDSNLEDLIRSEAADIRSNLLIKEDRINDLQSNLNSKADSRNLSNLNTSFDDLRTYTTDSLGTLAKQAYSNLPNQMSRLNQQVQSNETNLYDMGLALEEHGGRISALEASGGSSSNSPSSPITLNPTPSYSSNWNPAWAQQVQDISTNVLDSNYSNQRGLLMTDTKFSGHILNTTESHSNIAKLDQLDTIFNNRILPTVKANRFEGSNAILTDIETSNITINGSLDATDITTTGDITIGGDLIISNKESVPSSFSALRKNIQTVQGTANTVSSKFDQVFDINLSSSPGGSMIVWDPTIQTNNISSIDINTNVNIGSADNPKSLKMFQDADGAGGFIDVADFNKIRKVYRTPQGVNQYVNLQAQLDAAASGVTSPETLAAQLSNQRIIDLKTGTCDVDGRRPGCITIAGRLESLESDVSRIDSAIRSSPSPGGGPSPGGEISLGYRTDPQFDSIDVTGDASIGRNASIGGDATIDGDARINGAASINGTASITGNLTVNSSPNANMMMSSSGLELGPTTPFKIGNTNVGDELSNLDDRVNTLETTTNHPNKYVTDISVNGSNLQVTYEGITAPSPNTTTVTLPSSTQPIDLTSWKINNVDGYSASGDYPAYTSLSLIPPPSSSGLSTKTLNLPSRIVTGISYDDGNKELSFSYQDESDRGTNTIQLSNLEPPQNTDFTQGIKLGGIILKPDAEGNHIQICRGGNVGTATNCTPLWDHDQAPDPSSVSSRPL